jgi:hypothetical protein
MAKVWLPKLWASTIPSIWTCGRPNSGQRARRYGPRNASCADNSEIRHIIFRGCFRDLIFVSKKRMNTKVGDNFMEHNLDTEFTLFGVRTWEIWCRQGWLRIRKIWMRLSLWKPSSLLSQGRSSVRQGGSCPKTPQMHKYKP